MISFPNCKINLGLNVVDKRGDGFHNIETVFYPIPFTDGLELIQTDHPSLLFNTTGLPIEGNSNENICIKAYDLLKKDFPQLPFIKMHLHKCIPTGAGLGGGSADGTFTLQLINKKFNLQLTNEQLINYALQLGSDCPFFIKNKPCLATGRGEQLEEILLDLSAYKIVIVYPNIHISTAWAFSQMTLFKRTIPLKEIIQRPLEEWRENLLNDFEPIVFEKYPEIKKIKEKLYLNGAVYASMSGSGSAVFGFFDNSATTHLFTDQYFVKVI